MIVTGGAGGGIGIGATRVLAQAGWRVLVVEIDGQRSERAVDRSFGDIKHKPWFMYADRQFEEAYKNDLLRYNLQQ